MLIYYSFRVATGIYVLISSFYILSLLGTHMQMYMRAQMCALARGVCGC